MTTRLWCWWLQVALGMVARVLQPIPRVGGSSLGWSVPLPVSQAGSTSFLCSAGVRARTKE